MTTQCCRYVSVLLRVFQSQHHNTILFSIHARGFLPFCTNSAIKLRATCIRCWIRKNHPPPPKKKKKKTEMALAHVSNQKLPMAKIPPSKTGGMWTCKMLMVKVHYIKLPDLAMLKLQSRSAKLRGPIFPGGWNPPETTRFFFSGKSKPQQITKKSTKKNQVNIKYPNKKSKKSAEMCDLQLTKKRCFLVDLVGDL